MTSASLAAPAVAVAPLPEQPAPLQPAPRAPGRPRGPHQLKRAAIASHSARLFAQKGFHGTSTAEICEVAGVSKGVLYHYFSEKEDILYEIHQCFIAPILERSLQEVEKTPPEALVDYAIALMEMMAQHNNEVTVFVREWTYLRDTRYWDEVEKVRSSISNRVADTIARGVAEGCFRDDFDPKIAALSFIGMTNYAYQWYRLDGPSSAEDIGRQAGTIFVRGISRQPA